MLDAVSTAAVIASGGAELNPLGIPASIVLAHRIGQMPKGAERTKAVVNWGAAKTGAAGWNMAMLVSPLLAPVGFIVGSQMGADRALRAEDCQVWWMRRAERTGDKTPMDAETCK